uniref:NTR domain-containing protein n=1 Tax=Rhinolophus ferrumequinum TaxID=59479 RepID=A0A671EH26_RHIFE
LLVSSLGLASMWSTMEPSLLLAFPLLLALSTPCGACVCKIMHPQTHYCMSDIVIVADLLGPGNNTLLKRAFRVNIIKAPKNIPRINNIYTPFLWEKCGYEMRTSFQSHLLIAGYLRTGKINFTRCHLVYFWDYLTKEQKIGFEGAYRRGCKCQIPPCLFCWRTCPEPDFTECVWKQRNCEYHTWKGNHSLYAMCVPSTSGRCEWIQAQKYHNYQT